MSNRGRGKIDKETHAAVWERDGGMCIWPRCPERADEIMHFHSKGFGGTPDGRRNELTNMGLGCWSHARMSDGEHGEGGRTGYVRAHRDLLGEDYDSVMLPWTVAWERAEALRRRVSE